MKNTKGIVRLIITSSKITHLVRGTAKTRPYTTLCCLSKEAAAGSAIFVNQQGPQT